MTLSGRVRASQVIDEIARLPAAWHGVGSVNVDVLRAIAKYAERLGAIDQTVETGSGKTTLLFSHLSTHHTVFAVDDGDSINKVRSTPIFNAGAVTYVEGPTQRTLPRHVFERPVQMALIDGPHGYPFPDMEYFFLYPTLPTGAILIVDDIQIPTIRSMFEIIKADAMFHLEEVVATTAFFSRTAAPLVDPYGDGWWLQGFNKSYYDEILAGPAKRSTPPPNLAQRVADHVPEPLKQLVPEGLKRLIRGA